MTLYEKIVKIYPELLNVEFIFWSTVIIIQDNADGTPQFIAVWDYEKPRPTQEQLDALD